MRSLNLKPQNVFVWLHDVRGLLVLYGLAVDLRENNHGKIIFQKHFFCITILELLYTSHKEYFKAKIKLEMDY